MRPPSAQGAQNGRFYLNTTTMAKIYGLFGSMKGKVADVVMSVRNGNQIVRKYQPMVYNPSTQGQVAARAKLKLISQLSAVMGRVIAMPRMGIVSARNQFTKVNYPSVTYNSSSDPQTADIQLSAIKLTKSNVFLPSLSATVNGNNVTVELTQPENDIDKVVYAFFQVTPSKELLLVSDYLISSGGTFQVTGNINPSQKYIAYAYGIRINNDSARAKFAKLDADGATLVTSLITNRVITESDVTLTETRFVELNP